mmetsp:Transcript_20767/g.29025  ORF Transcript_20767/g.29025 Transcript_20767/m.29025 type:complete len:207 (-) Transcript_20767:276-896(-)
MGHYGRVVAMRRRARHSCSKFPVKQHWITPRSTHVFARFSSHSAGSNDRFRSQGLVRRTAAIRSVAPCTKGSSLVLSPASLVPSTSLSPCSSSLSLPMYSTSSKAVVPPIVSLSSPSPLSLLSPLSPSPSLSPLSPSSSLSPSNAMFSTQQRASSSSSHPPPSPPAPNPSDKPALSRRRVLPEHLKQNQALIHRGLYNLNVRECNK